MKKQLSFRLSDKACEALDRLKSEHEWSGAHVIERLLLGEPEVRLIGRQSVGLVEIKTTDTPWVEPVQDAPEEAVSRAIRQTDTPAKGQTIWAQRAAATANVHRQTIQKPGWKS